MVHAPVYAAYCHTRDIVCSFNRGRQQRTQLQYQLQGPRACYSRHGAKQ